MRCALFSMSRVTLWWVYWSTCVNARFSGAPELQDSGLFGLFSWILSAPLSHKTFQLTGSSTSTLPPSSISSPHFSSLWVLVYWISGICFPGPVTVRRGISHWRTALIYTPLWLSPQKIKLSKKFPIHPPSPQHTHTHTHHISSSSLLLPSMLYIIKLADVINTQTLLHSLQSYPNTPTFCHTQTVWWWDNQSNKLQVSVWFAGFRWKTATTDFKNSDAVSCSLCE